MKKHTPIIEDGIIAGNLYDKYGTKNLIVSYLMKGFYDSLEELVSMTGALDIHEVGCGEGYLSAFLAKENKTVRASDFSQRVIDKAHDITKNLGIDVHFRVANIYDLNPQKDAAEVVVCCEVLEHLEYTERAMQVLSKLATPYLLISVPREPIWRLLNLARGKYVSSLGNTPGHIQHWSKSSFLRLLDKHVDIINVRTPLPWIVALCKSRTGDNYQ